MKMGFYKLLVKKKALLLILGVGFLLRVYGLDYNLPDYVLQSDEAQIVVRALRFGYGDLNPHWFIYPSLYFYATFFMYVCYYILGHFAGIFASVQAFGRAFFEDPTIFYLLPRLMSAVLSMLTIAIVYLTALKMFANRRSALLSALFLAVSFYHIRESHSAKPDAAMIFLVMLSFMFCVYFYRDGKKNYAILASVLVGLGMSTKYTAGVAIIVLIMAHVLRPGLSYPKKLLWLNISLLAVIAGFGLGTPYALLDWQEFVQWLDVIRGHQGIILRDQDFAGMSGYWFYLRYAWPESSGVFLGIVSAVGILMLLRKEPRCAWLLLSFPLCTCLYLGKSSLFLSHYFTPCVPFLAIFAGVAAEHALARMRLGVRILIILILVMPSLYLTCRQLYWFTVLDTAVVAKYWIEENIPDGSRLVFVRSGIPVNMSRELIDETLKESDEMLKVSEPKADPYIGFCGRYTGKGAYCEYLREHPKYPAYYYIVVPRAAEINSPPIREFDFSLYATYDYAVVMSKASANEKNSGAPITIHKDMRPEEKEVISQSRIFLADIRRHCILKQFIDHSYRYRDMEKSPIKSRLFRFWGRPGFAIAIYRIPPK